MGNKKILIADDEPDILKVMKKKIEGEGYEVVSAKDGVEAWNKIVKESPDIIILDLSMPKKDGLTVLKDLREKPPSEKWQPVIIVSARNEFEDIQEGLTLEADHYLTKPCKPDDVIKAIQQMEGLIPLRKSKIELDLEKKDESQDDGKQ